MSGTYTGSYASIILTVNPATISGGATVSGSANNATGVSGPSGTYWTLVNEGLITQSGSASYGISFASGGTIVNDSSGVVYGNDTGVVITGGGSLSNQSSGHIYGFGGVLLNGAAATVVNQGTIAGNPALAGGFGVNLQNGGAVTNQSGGTISGYFGIIAQGAAVNVVNSGFIIGYITSGNADGISLGLGGSVTNALGATISGHNDGIQISGASGIVDNLGNVYASTNSGAFGIYLGEGGAVTNGASGSVVSVAYINGYNAGISGASINATTVTNYGTVNGLPGGTGVVLTTGTIINGPDSATGAIINGGGSGVTISGAGTISNYGSITGGGNTNQSGAYFGVDLGGAGTISNLGISALISAYVGVYAQLNDTIINSGMISSNTASGFGIVFGGGTNKLIVDPGAQFIGTVSGSGGVTMSLLGGPVVIGSANNGVGVATLELASGASAGTLATLGTNFMNFSSLVFDSGASWTVAGDDSAGGLGTLGITGFAVNDTIDLTGFIATGATFGNNVLTLTSADPIDTLNIQGNFVSADFILSTDAATTGTDIIVCFAEGTRIATPLGSARIEDLKIDDLVETYFGGATPVQWIGRRYVDCTRHPEPRGAWPVRVAANAFGAGCPDRDLFLSPNHAVYVLDNLIPIKYLINGTSIEQVPVDQITYYHVELAQHDMIWAEGLRAETYLDVGDRANFSNGDAPMRLFPDFATCSTNSAALWETMGCAPLVIHGPRLQSARTWVNGMADADARAIAA